MVLHDEQNYLTKVILITDLPQQNTSSSGVAQVLERLQSRIVHPKLHQNTGAQESTMQKETDASESSHPINLLNVSTLFRKSSTMKEQLDISSFRCPPLSSFSPTYVSGWEKRGLQHKQTKMSQLDLFQRMPPFNHYHSHHNIWSKAQTRHLCTPRSMWAKKVGSPTADI